METRHKAPKHVDLSTHKVFRHILAQEGWTSIIKARRHARKQDKTINMQEN